MSWLDHSQVYAVPGAGHIIDVIDPQTGLTLYGGKSEAAIMEQYPGAVRMSFDAWQADKAARQNTPIEWHPTTAEKYAEMLCVLPPAFWQAGVFLVGEPDDHDALTGRPRFQAYRQIGESYLVASRPMTIADARALVRS